MPRVAPGKAEMGLYTYGRLGKAACPVAQYYIDVSGLRDPSSNRGFRKLYTDGRHGEVQEYLKADPRVDAVFDSIRMIAHLNLRGDNTKDGKWLSFAIKDHHGVWIAPAVAEIVADRLGNIGYDVTVFHYELGARV
jgi:RNase adaptor protein for sRNA GlmZ degradation